MIYVLGGGSGKSNGTLVVTGEITDPVSTVTITSTISGKTYTYTKTLDSSGKATFKGLLAGTWNITMTNGTQTTTDSIVITTGYTNNIVYWEGGLYDGTIIDDINKRQFISVTGGWQSFECYGSADSWHSFTEVDYNNIKQLQSNITVSGNLRSIAMATVNKIDLSKFSKLHLQCTTLQSDTPWNSCFVSFGVSDVKDTTVWGKFKNVGGSNADRTQLTGTGEFTYDVSSFTSSKYIVIVASFASDGSFSNRISRFSKVWLT